MTQAKKGSRRIVVDGWSLRFSIFRKGGVRGCPDCDNIYVIIADDSRKGSVVHVRVDEPSGPDIPSTPRIIASAATRALVAGWRPGAGKGVFLSIAAGALHLASPDIHE